MRRNKLIHPSLQLRLTAKFVGVCLVAMTLQLLFLGYFLVNSLSEVEGPGGELAAQMPMLLGRVLAMSTAVVLPAMVVMGTLLTFRLAGPIHRFTEYLQAFSRGETDGPCRIREGDELGALCDAINAATRQVGSERDESRTAA